MMVINCSEAAAIHLYGQYKKGINDGFFEPASSTRDTVEERQDRLNSQGIIQWVIHAVKVGRSTILIAIEFDTRWVHVIHQVRKGDVKGFVERLNARLLNGIEWLRSDFSLFTPEQMEAGIKRYFTLHSELRFYQQTDRSAMSHINQVSAVYQDVYCSIGAFPQDEEAALEFDMRLNHDWRFRKGEVFDLQVDEKMIVDWMTNYLGKEKTEAQQSITEIKEAKRSISMSHIDTKQRLSESSPCNDNVVVLSDFRKSKPSWTRHHSVADRCNFALNVFFK